MQLTKITSGVNSTTILYICTAGNGKMIDFWTIIFCIIVLFILIIHISYETLKFQLFNSKKILTTAAMT